MRLIDFMCCVFPVDVVTILFVENEELVAVAKIKAFELNHETSEHEVKFIIAHNDEICFVLEI